MSGTEIKRILYWDACIYIAWLRDEEAVWGADAMEAITQAAKEAFETTTVIVTSTITFTEVLASKLDEEQERKFRRSFRFQGHIARDVDPPVAMKARQFRDEFSSDPGGKTLATPDALHLATASIYEANEFWTFDEGKRNKKLLGLLELNGDSRIGGLAICRPSLPKPPLFAWGSQRPH